MKSKNKFIQLKKFDFLENLTSEGLVSQLIVFYGDAINTIKESTESGQVNPREAVGILTDMILIVARLDVTLKRKSRVWWNGKMNLENANLPDNQWKFISGLYLISNPITSKEEIDLGIKFIQESIEIMSYSFNFDIVKLMDDLVNTHNTATDLIENEYAPKGVFVMDLVNKIDYKGIQLANKEFNTGVVPMDFFKASIHAITTNKEYGVKIAEELKNYIDTLDSFFVIKFFNHGDTNDNSFYTLKTEGTVNRLFQGDKDVTDQVSEERNGITIIPFVNYSMVLVTPEMEKLDDLLDYYNQYK